MHLNWDCLKLISELTDTLTKVKLTQVSKYFRFIILKNLELNTSLEIICMNKMYLELTKTYLANYSMIEIKDAIAIACDVKSKPIVRYLINYHIKTRPRILGMNYYLKCMKGVKFSEADTLVMDSTGFKISKLFIYTDFLTKYTLKQISIKID